MRRWLIVLPPLMIAVVSGCGDEHDERAESRARINTACAAHVSDMREELAAFEARAIAANADNPTLEQAIRREVSSADAFRNPDPCFGHASMATDVPNLFQGAIDARFAGLAAAYTNAGERDAYVRLEPATTQHRLSQHVGHIRELAAGYAETEAP